MVSAVLIPTDVMLFFYVQNKEHISFGWTAVIAAGCMVFTIVAWLCVYALFRSPVSAFASCLTGWLFLFLYNGIKGVIESVGLRMDGAIEIGLVAVTAVLILVTALLLRKSAGNKLRQPVMLFLWMLFVFNAVSAAFFLIGPSDFEEAPIKETFTVEEKEDRPNVYWIHCDGMLGFDSVERYFGDSQEWFAGELEERGFAINRDAAFNGRQGTFYAVAMLMCPDGYDNYIADNIERTRESAPGYSYFLSQISKLRLNNEVQHGFQAAGYKTRLIPGMAPYFYPTTDEVYVGTTAEDISVMYPDNAVQDKVLIWLEADIFLEYLHELSHPIATVVSTVLEKVTAFGVYGNANDERGAVAAKYPVTNVPSADFIEEVLYQRDGARNSMFTVITGLYNLDNSEPYFTIVCDLIDHCPYILDENGNVVREEEDSTVHDYLAQHTYGTKVLVNLVDMILQKDPDAVIVLQGDHGLHGNNPKDFQEAFGPDTPAEDLWNHVISAIRVPEKYQNGEEPYALSNPLNVSRYLVNNFVGHNYNYLP